MPIKPPVVCRSLGCGNPTTNRNGYCDDCADPVVRKRSKKRGDSFYWSTSWKKFRKFYLSNNPLCEQCQSDGALVPADVVDHIIEIKDGGARLSEDNVQSLCNRCHTRKTAEVKKERSGENVVAPSLPDKNPWL